ncbi:MAG: hypothetical protein IKA62_04530 [Clostridia bacterium]|nr:hypothetical protein [Clostridia bacterium]
MKKQLLSLVLALAMIMSLVAGMGITASTSNTEAIPVDEAIGLYEYLQDRYFVENIDDEDGDGTHWRYAYMTTAEGDAYLETLENATVGSVVAPQNFEEIINGFIPFVRASNDHDRLVILKVLDSYAGSSATTYPVQSYAYFNLGDEIDSIDFTVNVAAIPEMVPGQALATQDDYSVFINFMVNVLSFVDADKLDQDRSGVSDMVAKAPGGEWARVTPTAPIQAGYTYGVIVEVDGYWESVSGNAYYRAYFADRGAGVTVRCTEGRTRTVAPQNLYR